MHKFGFWDPKVHLLGPSTRPDNSRGSLECANVCSVGKGRRREAEVVHVGKGDSLVEVDVERGNINYESKGEIGEPCGVPTWTGAKTLGEPCKSKRQEH